jgi:hypothetical protein
MRTLAEHPWVAVAFTLVLAVALLHTVVRRRRARAVATRWLAEHDYRIRRVSLPWWSLRAYRFGPALLRNNDHAFQVRAEIEDGKLGGVGVVWLRVWIGWSGTETYAPDIFWESMPTAERGSAGSSGPPWEGAQLELLRRVAAGTHAFRPDDHRSPEAGAEFDLLVEHILALQRRGFLACATPVAETRHARTYALVSEVALTPEGERIARNLDH